MFIDATCVKQGYKLFTSSFHSINKLENYVDTGALNLSLNCACGDNNATFAKSAKSLQQLNAIDLYCERVTAFLKLLCDRGKPHF